MALEVKIHTEYITLGQLLKLTRIISTGGEEKAFVLSHDVTVNGVKENRRGRKLRAGDKLVIDGKEIEVCA
jgi:S4 domain protein YaaA